MARRRRDRSLFDRWRDEMEMNSGIVGGGVSCSAESHSDWICHVPPLRSVEMSSPAPPDASVHAHTERDAHFNEVVRQKDTHPDAGPQIRAF